MYFLFKYNLHNNIRNDSYRTFDRWLKKLEFILHKKSTANIEHHSNFISVK